MAYLGAWYIPILKKKLQEGVKISILTSYDSDTNHHTNMKCLSELLYLQSPFLKIFLSKKRMIHTKGLATRKNATIGAANFHNAVGYFQGLNEQNIYIENSEWAEEIFKQFQRDCNESNQIFSYSELPLWSNKKHYYETFFVFIGSILVFCFRKKIAKWRNMNI